MKKRVLITGLQGFTGHYMAKELSQDYEVFGLGSSVKTTETYPYFQVDLTDFSRLTEVVHEIGPSVVVHLAAQAFVAHENSNTFYEVNVIGTRNLLQAIATSAVKIEAVLLASSANVYGNSLVEVLSENAPVNPANDYAVSKLAMEYMAKLWFDKLPIIITRPFNYTGVGQSSNFLIPKIVKHFVEHKNVIELGNTEVSRDFSDVRMVVKVYKKLIESKNFGKIINVCSGKAYSLSEVIKLCEEITGFTVSIKVNPEFIRKNEIKILKGNNTFLQELIDVESIDLNETLKWMLHEWSFSPYSAT